MNLNQFQYLLGNPQMWIDHESSAGAFCLGAINIQRHQKSRR